MVVTYIYLLLSSPKFHHLTLGGIAPGAALHFLKKPPRVGFELVIRIPRDEMMVMELLSSEKAVAWSIFPEDLVTHSTPPPWEPASRLYRKS